MWKIDHAETQDDGTRSVCRLAFIDKDANGKDRRTPYQLQTAIHIPPPGPGHGQAIAALRQAANAFRHPPDPPDLSSIEDELNAGDE